MLDEAESETVSEHSDQFPLDPTSLAYQPYSTERDRAQAAREHDYPSNYEQDEFEDSDMDDMMDDFQAPRTDEEHHHMVRQSEHRRKQVMSTD